MAVIPHNFVSNTGGTPVPREARSPGVMAQGISAEAPTNLHVTFWGVQGSCPIFPTRAEIDDYTRRIAVATLERSLKDLAAKARRGELTPDLLDELSSPAQAEEYRRRLGLPHLPIYGGDTTCIEVRTVEGNTLVFDLGTGVRDCSRHLLGRPERTLYVFASHEHLDHRNGLSFASFCFEKENPFTVHVYGTRQFLLALDDRYGLYSRQPSPRIYTDDPLDYRVFSAKFTGTEIRIPGSSAGAVTASSWPTLELGEPIFVGSTAVTPFQLYHGQTPCLGYKVRHANSTFVFCTDHELRRGPDPSDERQLLSLAAEARLIEQCRGADAAYFDGQYQLAEYMGEHGISRHAGVSRIDWGHSCIEDVFERIKSCGIRRGFIGHHDPERTWTQRLDLDRRLRQMCAGQTFRVEMAKAGQTIEI